jgi:tetratricopeptide (TPR) repeat protein
LRGRIEDLSGWALFNQDKYAEAIERLKRAVDILPQGTPSWRGASWHLAVALEQSGNKEEALNYYIRSYKTGAPDPIRRTVIERLYRKINGSLDGLDDRIGTANTTTAASTPAAPTANKSAPNIETVATPSSVASGSAATPSSEPVSSDTPKTDAATAKPQATPVATPEPTPVAAAEPTPTPRSPETPVADSLSSTDASLRAAASRARLRVKISGRVMDANKNGLGNVVVVLISPSGTVLASTTDSEGNFSFVVATSQRTYRLIPSRDGYTFDPLDKVFDGLSDDQKEIEFVGTLKGEP